MNLGNLRENVVKFSDLDKINFDDLQKKRRLMNFNTFKKMKLNGLRESRAINLMTYKKKGSVMNFGGLEKMNFDNLQKIW